MAKQHILKDMTNIVEKLDNNKVFNFAYTDKAFDENDVDGVEVFDFEADQNIPKASHAGYDITILQKGARSQAASIPRNVWNHFVGRVSYNLNKLIQTIYKLLDHIALSSAHNCFEYDSTARYQHSDCCYIIYEYNDITVRTIYRRIGNNPQFIQNISPLVSGQTEWKALPESFDVQTIEYIDKEIILESETREAAIENLQKQIEKEVNTEVETLKIRVDNLQQQTSDAVAQLDAKKANLASPAFTGNPTVPTPATNSNNTRIATTAFVRGAITEYAPRPVEYRVPLYSVRDDNVPYAVGSLAGYMDVTVMSANMIIVRIRSTTAGTVGTYRVLYARVSDFRSADIAMMRKTISQVFFAGNAKTIGSVAHLSIIARPNAAAWQPTHFVAGSMIMPLYSQGVSIENSSNQATYSEANVIAIKWANTAGTSIEATGTIVNGTNY